VVSGRGCSSVSTTIGSRLRCGTSTGTISSANAPLVRRRPALLAAQRERVLVLAADPYLARRSRPSCPARRCAPSRPCAGSRTASRSTCRTTPASARRRLGLAQHVRCTAHRLDAPGEEDIALPRLDHPRRDVDRLEPRGAQPVHGRARHGLGNPASSAAMRATFRLSSPAWLAAPRVDVVDQGGSMPVRSTTARTRGPRDRPGGPTRARRRTDRRKLFGRGSQRVRNAALIDEARWLLGPEPTAA
jgi:hypothetical protein